MNPRQNPYIGPRSFRTGEKLFGRGRETAELIDLLIAERILLMNSPSGAGKSSLINARVIPLMRERGFTVFPPMRVSSSLPTDVAVSPAANRFVVSLLLSLEESQEREHLLPLDTLMRITFEEYLAYRMPIDASPDSVLFVFDQFEEILTIDPNQRAAKQEFFDQVGRALRDRMRWALFAVREEYVASLMPYERSIPTRFATSFRLDLLAKAGAMEAIREPAREAGVEFEQAAVEELERFLSLVRVQQPDGTIMEEPGNYIEPVQLQVVCRRLWDTLPPGATTITANHVKRVGQVERALSDYYDDVVAAAARQAVGGERAVREWVEKALIAPNGTRGDVMHTPKTSGGLDNPAIKVLVDGYLVREDNRRGSTWYELAHDRLIEPAKTSNAEWFEKSLQPMQRQAALWEREGRPDRLLLRGQDLKDAEIWARANAALVLAVEGAFLKRSAERRSAVRAKVIAAAAVSIVVLGFIGVVWILQIKLARMAGVYEVTLSNETQSWTAYANSALQNGNPDQAELLALRALPMDAQHFRPLSEDALSVLRDALGRDRQRAILVDHTWSKGSVKAVAVNHDGTRIATASDDRTARIFDARTGAALLLLNEHTDKVNSVAFSPNGLNVVTSSDDGTARVWNAVTGESIATLRAGNGPVRSATFGADDSHVATAAEDGIRIWNLSANPLNGQLLPGGGATAVTFSPDRKYVAVAGEDFVVHVFTVSGAVVQPLRGPTTRINAASFSPNGQRIVAASDDGSAWVWSINNPNPEAVLGGHEGKVLDANFSGDGKQIVTAASDAVARIFDSTGGDLIRQLKGHQASVSVARFSPDPQGRWIVTASDDRTARLWDPNEGTTAAILRGHRSNINAAVFTMDGQRLVTASDDGTARVWDARPSSAMPLLSTAPLIESADQIAFSLIAATRDPQSLDEDQVPVKTAALRKIPQSSGPCTRLEIEPPDPRDAAPSTPQPASDDIVACRTEAHRTNDRHLLYQLGMGLEKSDARAEAVAQYEAAAKLGNGAAYFRLALISFAQKEPSNGQRAVQYLRQGAEAGDPYCHRRLAELYESPTDGAADFGQALLHYILALRLFDSEVDSRNARYRAASISRNSPPKEVVKIARQATTWLSGHPRPTR